MGYLVIFDGSMSFRTHSCRSGAFGASLMRRKSCAASSPFLGFTPNTNQPASTVLAHTTLRPVKQRSGTNEHLVNAPPKRGA